MDDAVNNAAREVQLDALLKLIASLPHTRPTLQSAAITKRYPVLEIQFDELALGINAEEISRKLQRQLTPVHLGERRIHEGILLVDSSSLRPGEEKSIAKALENALK